MTQAVTQARERGSAGARASGRRTMPAVCEAQRGSSSPEARTAARSRSSSPPQTTAGKPFLTLEFPPVAPTASRAGAARSGLSSDLGVSQPSLEEPPRAEEQLVAAGGFRSVCVVGIRLVPVPVAWPGQSWSWSHTSPCSPQRRARGPQGSAPRQALRAVPCSARASRVPCQHGQKTHGFAPLPCHGSTS